MHPGQKELSRTEGVGLGEGLGGDCMVEVPDSPFGVCATADQVCALLHV